MKDAELGAFKVGYCDEPAPNLLGQSGTLAVFSFAPDASATADPRHVHVLQSALSPRAPRECWSVDAEVQHGSSEGLRWSQGGGWRFVVVEIDEASVGGIEVASEAAYDRLLTHVAACSESHLLRIWNYLGAINEGAGDGERYRLFCNGRARSMAARGISHYPAATAIGHRATRYTLQVYALCATHAGTALENPRQISAWEYPRQYGPTSPSFARAMQLPEGGLAISGTAAVIGHASHHTGDVAAQTHEAVTNLHALLERAELPVFDAASPLKVYVRHPADAELIGAVLDERLGPAVPRLLLQGDICRRELLVEIDGWRFTR